jgi:hypothetical protein
VVIDDAFLLRLDTENPRTTRDPAIRLLRTWYHAEYKPVGWRISLADLRNGCRCGQGVSRFRRTVRLRREAIRICPRPVRRASESVNWLARGAMRAV